MPTLRSEYSFEQFETVLHKLAHAVAIQALTNLEGRSRITIDSTGRLQNVETKGHIITFYASHIGYSLRTTRGEEHWGFDVEDKFYITSNHRTKISFVVQVEGRYDQDKEEYIEIGRKEKEQKRAEEIREFIQKLMTENGIKVVPRFTIKQIVNAAKTPPSFSGLG